MRLGLSSARKALPTVAARSISSAGQLAPRVHDCVVVGGGISGLTTAFRLAEVFPSGIAQLLNRLAHAGWLQHGRDVVVAEADSCVGGNIATRREGKYTWGACCERPFRSSGIHPWRL
jgi:glycine/D-amino acid oxidase-like deaminating enzyme